MLLAQLPRLLAIARIVQQDDMAIAREHGLHGRLPARLDDLDDFAEHAVTDAGFVECTAERRFEIRCVTPGVTPGGELCRQGREVLA
jgi:hypothetical protein